MTGTRAFERRRSDVVAGLVGLSGLAICGFIVRDGSVGSFERSIFESLNGLPDALEPPMRIAQLLGVLVVGPITAIVASTPSASSILLRTPPRRRLLDCRCR